MTDAPLLRYLRWMCDGYEYFASRLKLISDRELAQPSALPGWTGKHVVSHVGHNASALARLAHWAATGERTPMYPNPAARDAEIQAGADWSVPTLRAFVEQEQRHLTTALARITGEEWQVKVVTAQGRTITAETIPWLRTRELWIHACDLPGGGEFADFPDDVVDALLDDALTRRRTAQSLDVAVLATDRPGGTVVGQAADLARWLTGRGTSPTLHTPAGTALPHLPPWL